MRSYTISLRRFYTVAATTVFVHSQYHRLSLLSSRPLFATAAFSSSSSSSTTKEDIMSMSSTINKDRLIFHKLDTIESTQDEARRLLKQHENFNTKEKKCMVVKETSAPEQKEEEQKCIAVSAKEQTLARGTQGRKWIATRGNMFLTVAIPMKKIPVMITLLPLKVGTIVAKSVKSLLTRCNSNSKVTLKWPNDVLVDDQKIAGILIENEISTCTNEIWLLIGIGVNILHAPNVPISGPDRGRTATSILDACTSRSCSASSSSDNNSNTDDCNNDDEDDNDSNIEWLMSPPSEEDGNANGDIDKEKTNNTIETLVAMEVASSIVDWVYVSSYEHEENKQSISDNVITEFKQWTEFQKPLKLRDKGNGSEEVIPIDVERDGQLRVRDAKTGKERLLVADYLF